MATKQESKAKTETETNKSTAEMAETERPLRRKRQAKKLSETELWWRDHRAFKANLMLLIVQTWMSGADKKDIKAKVMEHLEEHKDWLPCEPDEFYANWLWDFWPDLGL